MANENQNQNTPAEMEYKVAPMEFKAAGDAGEYEGHFAVFGNEDDGWDITHPGAFEKTIRERGKRIKVFYAHDWMKLIGPPPEVLQEDNIGLYAKGRLTLDSFWGKETWALMKDGALTEGSFGFQAVKFDYEDVGGRMVRHLRELKLYEISPVPLGMNPMTQIRAVKAALEGGAGQSPEFLDGKIEMFSKLLADLKAGRVLSAASKEKVSNAVDAIDAAREALVKLLEAAEPDKGQGAENTETVNAEQAITPKLDHSALLIKRMRAAELALVHRP